MYHFFKDHVEKGIISLTYIPTDKKVADIFTKPLDYIRFALLRGKLEMLDFYA